MSNPDPAKFYTLPEAFNVLGRERFGDKWKGDELKARPLPPPKDTFRAVEIATAEIDRARLEKVERAKKASFAVGGGFRTIYRRPRGSDHQKVAAKVARHVALSPEIVEATRDRCAYRKEHRARFRKDEVEREFRERMYDGQAPSSLLNSLDGRPVEIPHTHWLADMFVVDFATGQGGWTDLEEDQQLRYQGAVLIDRDAFDRAGRDLAQSIAGAEAKHHDRAPSAPDQSVDPAPVPTLTEKVRRKGGSKPKYDSGLQTFVDHVHGTFLEQKKNLTLENLKDWLQENAPADEPLEQPENPDCDEVYVEADKINWTDRSGQKHELALRSLDRYVRRAKNRKSRT